MQLLQTTIERRLPKELFHVLASIGFWNEQGQQVYEQNKAGKMGSKFTQGEANKLPYTDFCFNSLLSEIESFSQSSEHWPAGYKYGKGGSHIWVSNPKNERVLFIHF